MLLQRNLPERSSQHHFTQEKEIPEKYWNKTPDKEQDSEMKNTLME